MSVQKKLAGLKWRQVALLSVGVSVIGGLASITAKKEERTLYNKKLKQAPWVPPAWLFGPAWMFNNFFLLLAL